MISVPAKPQRDRSVLPVKAAQRILLRAGREHMFIAGRYIRAPAVFRSNRQTAVTRRGSNGVDSLPQKDPGCQTRGRPHPVRRNGLHRLAAKQDLHCCPDLPGIAGAEDIQFRQQRSFPELRCAEITNRYALNDHRGLAGKTDGPLCFCLAFR